MRINYNITLCIYVYVFNIPINYRPFIITRFVYQSNVIKHSIISNKYCVKYSRDKKGRLVKCRKLVTVPLRPTPRSSRSINYNYNNILYAFIAVERSAAFARTSREDDPSGARRYWSPGTTVQWRQWRRDDGNLTGARAATGKRVNLRCRRKRLVCAVAAAKTSLAGRGSRRSEGKNADRYDKNIR